MKIVNRVDCALLVSGISEPWRTAAASWRYRRITDVNVYHWCRSPAMVANWGTCPLQLAHVH